MPVHQHLYYNETFNLKDEDFPVASGVFPRLVSLPIYPGMTDQNVDYVIELLTLCFKSIKNSFFGKIWANREAGSNGLQIFF